MKKTNVYTSKLLLILVAAFFMMNCEKQNESEFVEEPLLDGRLTHISFDDFQTKLGNDQTFNTLSKNFDIYYKADEFDSQKSGKWDKAEILTDKIVLVEGQEMNSFTFVVDKKDPDGHFYNLKLDVDASGEVINSVIIRYTSHLDHLQNPSEHGFKGWVHLEEDNAFGLKGASIANSGGLCVTGITWEWECNAGNEHAPNTCNAGGSDLIVQLTYGACPDDGGPNPTLDTGGDGGGGLGNGDGGGAGFGGGNPSGGNGGTSPLGDQPCPSGGTGLSGTGGCFNAADAQLENLKNSGVIADYKRKSVPSNAPKYDDVNGMLEDIYTHTDVTSSVVEALNPQKKLHTTRLESKFGIANLNLQFDSELQNLDGTGTYKFLGGTSFISGQTSLQTWTETENAKLISVDQKKHTAVIQFNATYAIGVKLGNLGYEVTAIKRFDIKIDTRTGDMTAYRVFTSF